MNRKLKERLLFGIEIFCNIIHDFHASLQNKNINFLKINDPKFLNGTVYYHICYQ